MESGDAVPDVDADVAQGGLGADGVLTEGDSQVDGDAGTTTAMDVSEDMATAPEAEDDSLQQPTGDFPDTILSVKSIPLYQLLSDTKSFNKTLLQIKKRHAYNLNISTIFPRPLFV